MKLLVLCIFLLFFLGTIFPNISANTLKNPNTKNPIVTQYSTYEYIIITTKYFQNSYFQQLLDHKSQFLTTKMVFVEDIMSNPDFSVTGAYGDGTSASQGNHWVSDGEEVTSNFGIFDDKQARIRNFCRYAKDVWNTKYVLLGGDIQFVPVRKLRINETWWYGGISTMWTYANIRSDLYYAALDGTWNNDFDQFFGEAAPYSVAEEADFVAELYVGRAPVSNKNDVVTFVNKVISFENSEKPENLLFHQAGMNKGNNPDSSVVPENCYTHVFDHYTVYKLYQIHTLVTKDKYVDNWQDPDKLIVLHVGSGENYCYYIDRQTIDIKFTTDDVDELYNTFYPVHISISCNSGNFGLDHNCLAEEMLLYPNGGPSACIFNSFYGVASEDSAHKYSGEFIESMFIEIFEDGTERLGEIVTKSKYDWINQAKSDLLYRWCYYTVNLLGDPETSLFEVRNSITNLEETYVDDNYGASTPGWQITHFNKISDGINAVTDSGTVHVYSGTYNENLDIEKPVKLIGSGKDTTFIIGDHSRDVIRVYDEVTITGFTVKNSGYTSSYAGISIYTPLNVIKDNTIYNNQIGIKIEKINSEYPIDNKINNNNFKNNLINAEDQYGNKWYGNYWDDYDGVDENNDDIGDSYYYFSENVDYCPFIDESDWDNSKDHLPIIPIIKGPTHGRPNRNYSYDFISADPDDDKIHFYIDMGDNSYHKWVGPFSSCEEKNILYYYEKADKYTIKAKAKDSSGTGEETDWATLEINMPRNTNPRFPILNKLLNIFQNFFLI